MFGSPSFLCPVLFKSFTSFALFLPFTWLHLSPCFARFKDFAGLPDITFQSVCVLSSAVLGYDGNDFLGTEEMAPG